MFGNFNGGIGTGQSATTTAWSDTAIRCIVPEMDPQGLTIRVSPDSDFTQGQLRTYRRASFWVDPFPAPVVSSVSPAQALPGATVVISGSSFRSPQGTSTLKFGATSAAITSWSDTAIVCTVPALAPGATTVTVTVGGQTSNAFAFTVDAPAPLLASVTPSHALAGAAVTIAGSNLGAAQGTSTLKFGATSAAITSWSDTAIVCTVPALAPGATTVTVTVGGQTSNAFAFTVDAPAPLLASVTPSHALAGAAVTIDGSNLGAAQGSEHPQVRRHVRRDHELERHRHRLHGAGPGPGKRPP